jgi:hypothetical protein
MDEIETKVCALRGKTILLRMEGNPRIAAEIQTCELARKSYRLMGKGDDDAPWVWVRLNATLRCGGWKDIRTVTFPLSSLDGGQAYAIVHYNNSHLPYDLTFEVYRPA